MEKEGQSFENMPEDKEKYEGIISKIEAEYNDVKEVSDNIARLTIKPFERTRDAWMHDVSDWAMDLKNRIESCLRDLRADSSQSPHRLAMIKRLEELYPKVLMLINTDSCPGDPYQK